MWNVRIQIPGEYIWTNKPVSLLWHESIVTEFRPLKKCLTDKISEVFHLGCISKHIRYIIRLSGSYNNYIANKKRFRNKKIFDLWLVGSGRGAFMEPDNWVCGRKYHCWGLWVMFIDIDLLYFLFISGSVQIYFKWSDNIYKLETIILLRKAMSKQIVVWDKTSQI